MFYLHYCADGFHHHEYNYSSIINCTMHVRGWLQLHYVPAVSANNMENIFSRQILSRLFSYIYSSYIVFTLIMKFKWG